MKKIMFNRRILSVIAFLVPLMGLLVYVALRSGPLAPIAVTEVLVDNRAISPGLFGVGTVEARHVYVVGPSSPGRIRSVLVDVGDHVRAGQLLAEMDPVDLDARVSAGDAASGRAKSLVVSAEAKVQAARSQRELADLEMRRYEKLGASGFVSKSTVDIRREQLKAAEAQLASDLAALEAARGDHLRLKAETGGARQQRQNVRLVATADGIVTARMADPGTTVVAGQAVLEVIDPQSVWVNVRFDQVMAIGLDTGLPAKLNLRSRGDQPLPGRVVRVEPKADAITEETMAKIVFDELPAPLPPIGELAEVTVNLQSLPDTPVIPNAAVQRLGEQTGVWRIDNGKPRFVPVRLGRSDLDGWVQVVEGIKPGERIVHYSEKAISSGSRIRVVDRIPGVGT